MRFAEKVADSGAPVEWLIYDVTNERMNEGSYPVFVEALDEVGRLGGETPHDDLPRSWWICGRFSDGSILPHAAPMTVETR